MGPTCLPELRAAGIDSAERIRELGWEEAYLRWVERFPSRVNVNAAVAMVAAEHDIHWLSVSLEQKERARRLVQRLRGETRRT
jgi:hypothetical protein